MPMLTSPDLPKTLLTACPSRSAHHTERAAAPAGIPEGRVANQRFLRQLTELLASATLPTLAAVQSIQALIGASDRVQEDPEATIAAEGGPHVQGVHVDATSAVPSLDGVDVAENPVPVRVLTAWHLTPKGCQSCSIEVGGQRALLMQRSAGGPFYLRVEGASKNKQAPISLRTRVQKEAVDKAGIELARRMSTGGSSGPTPQTTQAAVPRDTSGPAPVPASGALTLKCLMDEYWGSVALAKNDCATRAAKTSSGRILLGYFGREKLVADLTQEDFGHYELARIQGGVTYRDYTTTPTGRVTEVVKKTNPVRKRAVQSDLVLLRTMCNWARRNLRRDGVSELPDNPLDGYMLPKEMNPTRRIMPQERFEAIRDASQRMAMSPNLPRDEQLRMAMFHFAFVTTEFLGRRIGTVRQLTRQSFTFNQHVDFEGATVEFAGLTNKNGQADRLPIPSWFARMVHQYCEVMPLPASGWLFWRLGTDSPISTALLLDLFEKAQGEAGLEPIGYMKWHSLRRKWATECLGFPISAVMITGGWKDFKAFLECYQHTDRGTILKVLERDLKLHGDGILRSTEAAGRDPGNRPALRLVCSAQ